MPELPEVERGRRLAAAAVVGRRIVSAWVADDPIVFDRASPRVIERATVGRTVLAVHRHGKQLWLELDRPPHLLIHFGMTGALHVPGGGHLALASGIDPGDAWPPRFTKLILRFDDTELAFTNARRLGRVRLRDRPREEPPISELGFDALTGAPSLRGFQELARRRSSPVKAVLLDQSFAAGVGNWIADEVLYQARIDPRRAMSTLGDRELARVRTWLLRVVRTAVDADADKAALPRSWLFHHRWGRVRGRTIGGHVIEHIEIGGRTTAWVPARQR